MRFLIDFYRSLTMKPQGFTMIVAAFLPVFAIIAIFPVVALIIGHFKDDPDAAFKVPAMVTAPGYAIAVLAPFAGVFVDRFGRRRLLLWSTLFYGVVGSAPFLLDDLDAIIASRILLGVCEAGILTTVNTLIADYWDDRGRRNWLMLQGLVGPALQPLVFILVAAVAGVRWNAGFLVYLVAVPIFVAMYAFLKEPPRPVADPQSPAVVAGPFPVASAAVIAMVTLFSSIIYYVFIVNGSIVWNEIGVKSPMDISKVTVLPSLFIVAGALLFRFMSRLANAAQIAIYLVLLGVGLIIMGNASSVIEMQIGLAVQQTGAGMAIPAMIAWTQSKFDFVHRGRGMGVWTSCFFLGQAISPLIIGNAAAGAGSMQWAFAASGAVALAGAGGLALLAIGRSRRAGAAA